MPKLYKSKAKKPSSNTKVAKKTSSAIKKGTHVAKKGKVWHRTTFKRPTCLKQKRSPKNILRAVEPVNTWDEYRVIRHPIASESAIKNIEEHNTLVFIVDKKATKPMIKRSVKALFKKSHNVSMNVKKVSTMITPKGQKKAYICISRDQEALNFATKLGIL